MEPYYSSLPTPSSYILSTSNPTTPYPSLFSSSPSLKPLPARLCDWTKDIYNCRDSDFTRTLLIVSTGIYIVTGSYGMWVLAYRNRGFNHRIVTSLFSYGNGLQPKPVCFFIWSACVSLFQFSRTLQFDCLIFFGSVAFMTKIPANLFLILDLLPNAWGYRIFFEQCHW